MVVKVVFRSHRQGTCLQAHIDVFRNQDDLACCELLLQRAHDTQNLIVGFAHGEVGRQGPRHRLGLKKQASGCILVTQAI